MTPRYTIEFEEPAAPLTGAVTKFGGQPVWLEQPRWPLSRSTNQPMRFIAQIQLPQHLYAGSEVRMAYIFMTDGEEFVDGTWDAESGENAVLIQPGGGPAMVETQPLATGPTLYRMASEPGAHGLTPEPCEFAVTLVRSADPKFVFEDDRYDLSESEEVDYENALAGSKIGGTPLFVQGDEFPAGGPWSLLLQLDSTMVPFSVNFGDAGVGYAFVSKDGTLGRFVWQCA